MFFLSFRFSFHLLTRVIIYLHNYKIYEKFKLEITIKKKMQTNIDNTSNIVIVYRNKATVDREILEIQSQQQITVRFNVCTPNTVSENLR